MIRNAFLTGLVVFFAAPGLWAQGTLSSVFAQGPSPYGNGEQPRPGYAGAASPRNLLFLSLDSETAYDDNLFSNNRLRRGDLAFAFGPRIAFLQQRKYLRVALDYQPYFLLYRRTPQYSRLNHALGLDLNYQAGPRFALRLRDSFSYQTGIFRPRSSEDFMPALGSPSNLNETVFTPLARQRANTARLDAIYQKSRRTSFTLFGSSEQRNFNGAVGQQHLFDTRGASGGLNYLHRLGPHTSLGILYLFQNLSFGKDSRVVTHSTYASFAWRLSPTVSLEAFGGPQYARLHDRFVLVLPFFGGSLILPQSIFRTQWHAAAGGTFTKRSEKTVFQISAQRVVTDGGGLLTSVTSSVVDVSLRRRLTRRWDAIWDLNAARSDALGFQFTGSSIRSQSAAFALEHSLTERLTARLGYNFIRQRTSGPVPFLTDFDRNRVSFGVFYQVRRIPLGR